ncbi:MAG: hypothetical protein CFE23_12825 [Flavobacterium sp. BFFFF1]|nr:MAG: hypothetical protein CFE23_12825 [Flavobacterium sp. BFFFF1]
MPAPIAAASFFSDPSRKSGRLILTAKKDTAERGMKRHKIRKQPLFRGCFAIDIIKKGPARMDEV